MIYISNTRLLKYASTEKAVGPTINLEYVCLNNNSIMFIKININ